MYSYEYIIQQHFGDFNKECNKEVFEIIKTTQDLGIRTTLYFRCLLYSTVHVQRFIIKYCVYCPCLWQVAVFDS